MKKPRPHSSPASSPRSQSIPASDKGGSPTDQDDNDLNSLSASNTPLTPSQQSSLHDFIQEEAKCLPDIRQDRVDQIRAALKSGNYRISSDLIADRILQDTILDESSNQD